MLLRLLYLGEIGEGEILRGKARDSGSLSSRDFLEKKKEQRLRYTEAQGGKEKFFGASLI